MIDYLIKNFKVIKILIFLIKYRLNIMTNSLYQLFLCLLEYFYPINYNLIIKISICNPLALKKMFNILLIFFKYPLVIYYIKLYIMNYF